MIFHTGLNCCARLNTNARELQRGQFVKRLLIVVLVVTLGWFAYWAFMAQTAKSGFKTWFETRRAEGWQAEYSDLSLRGFPNRIDTTFEDLRLADPDTGFAWAAPFFQLFALSYRPNHLIAVWPHQQSLSTPLQKLALDSADMRASAVFHPNTNLALKRANFATDALEISSSLEWDLSADSLRLALAQDEADETLYQLALQGQGVAPPAALRNNVLPQTMSALDLDVGLGFDRPWDIRALEERRPQPTAITLRTAKAEWGPMLFQAAGDMTADNVGILTGELTLRIDEWEAMIQMARDLGQIDPILIDGTEQLLRLFSSLSGPGEKIDLTLTFRNGRAYVGLLPIGPAPRIFLR